MIKRKMKTLVAPLMLMVAMLSAPALYAAAAISQGYVTEDNLSIGAIVSRGKSENSVVASSPDGSKDMVGVVSSRALLEISDGSQREVQVATSGTAEVLVSTLNGDVRAGDRVVPSPVLGVGMYASESGHVVGVAAADFSKARNVTEREIVAKDGTKTTVKIGLLPIEIGVGYYEKTANESILPDFITNLAKTIAGRDVSVARVIAAGAILVVGLVVVVVLVSSSARSSIISIGRNPLAAGAVHRGLLEASGLAIGILLVMLIAVYLVLVI